MTPMEALMGAAPFTEIPRSRLEFDSLANLMELAVAQLSDLDKDILIAKVYEKLTFREIADRHDISKSNAHWRYNRSITNVRNWLTTWAYEKGVAQFSS